MIVGGEPQEGIRTVLYSYMWRPGCFFLQHGGGALGVVKSPGCNYHS